MSWQWSLAAALLFLAFACFLPMIFERETRASRFFSLSYQLKLVQHLFPADRERGPKLLSELITHKDRWSLFDTNSIGRRVRTIRELSGGDPKHHLLAVELSGVLVKDLASCGIIKMRDSHLGAPLSASDILARLAEDISPEFAPGKDYPDKDAKLRLWLRKEAIDIEQVVELMIAVIEILHARIELSIDEPKPT